MAYGFRAKNDAGYTQIDQDWTNLHVVSSGTVNSGAKVALPSSLGDNFFIFGRIKASSRAVYGHGGNRRSQYLWCTISRSGNNFRIHADRIEINGFQYLFSFNPSDSRYNYGTNSGIKPFGIDYPNYPQSNYDSPSYRAHVGLSYYTVIPGYGNQFTYNFGNVSSYDAWYLSHYETGAPTGDSNDKIDYVICTRPQDGSLSAPTSGYGLNVFRANGSLAFTSEAGAMLIDDSRVFNVQEYDWGGFATTEYGAKVSGGNDFQQYGDFFVQDNSFEDKNTANDYFLLNHTFPYFSQCFASPRHWVHMAPQIRINYGETYGGRKPGYGVHHTMCAFGPTEGSNVGWSNYYIGGRQTFDSTGRYYEAYTGSGKPGGVSYPGGDYSSHGYSNPFQQLYHWGNKRIFMKGSLD